MSVAEAIGSGTGSTVWKMDLAAAARENEGGNLSPSSSEEDHSPVAQLAEAAQQGLMVPTAAAEPGVDHTPAAQPAEAAQRGAAATTVATKLQLPTQTAEAPSVDE